MRLESHFVLVNHKHMFLIRIEPFVFTVYHKAAVFLEKRQAVAVVVVAVKMQRVPVFVIVFVLDALVDLPLIGNVVVVLVQGQLNLFPCVAFEMGAQVDPACL